VEDPAAGSFEHIRGLAFGEIPRTPQTDQSLVRLYDAEIAYADRQFGMLLDDLRRRGLYDEMLILFVSDHGEGFYEHGIQGHGWDLYRESTQVPMILKLPGKSSGHRVQAMAQQIDLLPTLLDLAGMEVPDVVQGRSLVPLLAREPTSEAEPIEVFSYLDYEGRKGMSVIYGQWKLIEPLSSSFAPSRELYDRLEDPDEQIDLSAQYPILAGYLATLVRQRLMELEQLPEVESMEFDDETRQQLKALGYLE
jgi:arylsulfatase A-like enzyme